ncbi:MAG: DUF6962 family protein [Chloroflexota bacterium]
MRFRVHEPAVALTDLAIGVEAASFALLLTRAGGDDDRRSPEAVTARRWFVVFFAATSLAALTGAALHGLFVDREDPARRRLWRVSLGSIGIAGLSAWCLGAVLALPRASAVRLERTMIAVHAAYLALLSRTSPPYSVAIATYIPGSVALGVALVRGIADSAVRVPSSIALAGLSLTFGAAAIQVRRIAIHPRLFDHNATYHAIQAIAIACFYAAARGFIQPTGRR